MKLNQIKPGTVIRNRYKIIQFLNSGGSSYLYLAYDKIAHMQKAIKILKWKVHNCPQPTLQQIKNEYKILRHLNHNHIIHFYDYIIDNNYIFLVMEYLAGETLKEKTINELVIPWAKIFFWFQQINQAVSYLHQHNIIHSDLKPENIFICADGRVVLFDFGTSCIVEPTGENKTFWTKTDDIIGTSFYLSPEMVQGQILLKTSDIYALGIILYELLVGEPPFFEMSYKLLAYKLIWEIPIHPQHIVFNLPPKLSQIVLKAIAKEPYTRYVSVEDFNNDLLTLQNIRESQQKNHKCNTAHFKVFYIWKIKNHYIRRYKVKERYLFFPSQWSVLFLSLLNIFSVFCIIIFCVLVFFI